MNKFLRVLFILVILAMTGAIIFQLFFPTYMGGHSGVRYFSWLAEGDWYLECGSPCHPDCRKLQVRLVLSESCTDSFDYWRPRDWDQSFP